ncbi:Subunit of heteropentameric Replication factor C (RF-C) [Malassezia japonica]|uniref:Replication factor C subunit 3 n=1 Tax=Malassezia japonica TaxID=223818 RepID=A0AAF0JBM2_9BASI|nr:Subunit of heteropentameric Replication factor C (RF-C) [Malassezia japonica]WFD40648.1 Subunit of heteropentameric Replication factor C (RF-C) [Malassezia japonica]
MSDAKGKGKAGDAPAQDLLPWVEKYRPSSLDEIMSHAHITSTLEKFVAADQLPHLLFYGPPGTGKTSTIMALAQRLYGKNFKNHVLELNASDDRGIDVVRGQIKSFASTRNVFSTQQDTFKLIVLDEADAMTQAAQAALRRVIEQYTKNVRFCIICNYVNKIIPAIQSRCTRFRFSPLDTAQIARRVDTVIDAEQCQVEPAAKDAILHLAKGDMRRALNILQACHAAGGVIDEDAVYNCTGNPHPKDIETAFQAMLQQEFTTAYQTIQTLKVEKGTALADLLNGMHDLVLALELPPHARAYLLDQMAQIEYRLSTSASERIQLAALLGAVKAAVDLSQRT